MAPASTFNASAFALEFANAPAAPIPALSEGLAQLLASTASAECRSRLTSDGSVKLLAGKLDATFGAW
jgi:hypothetical protein